MAAKLLYRDAQGRDAAVDLLPEGAFLGRAVDCIVRTDDAMVSRKNCKISFLGGRWYVEDLGSANGSFINERRVQKEMINHGDVIRCGSLQVRFVEVAADSVLPVPRSQKTPPIMPSAAAQDATSGLPAIKMDELNAAIPPEQRLTSESKPQVPVPLKPTVEEELQQATAERDAAQHAAEEARAQCNQLLDKLEAADQEQKRLRTELLNTSDAKDRLAQQYSQVADELHAMQGPMEELRADKKQLEIEREQEHRKVTELGGQLEAKDQQLLLCTDDVRRTKQLADGLKNKVAQLTEDLEQERQRKDGQGIEAEHLREVIRERERLIEEQRGGLQKQEAQLKDIQNQLGDKDKALSTALAEGDNLRDRVARLNKRLEDLQESYNQLMSQPAPVDRTSPDQTSEVLALTTERDRLKAQLADAQEDLHEAQTHGATLQGEHEQLATKLMQTEARLHDIEGKLTEAEGKLGEAQKASALTPQTAPPPPAGDGEAENKLKELMSRVGSAYDDLNGAISELRLSVVQTEETYDRMERTIPDREAAKKLRGAIDQTKDRADEAKGQVRNLRRLLD